MDRYVMPLHDLTARRDSYAVCPSCGNFAHLLEGQSFCVVCGEKMLTACPKCSSPLKVPTARFCPHCGGQLVFVRTTGEAPLDAPAEDGAHGEILHRKKASPDVAE